MGRGRGKGRGEGVKGGRGKVDASFCIVSTGPFNVVRLFCYNFAMWLTSNIKTSTFPLLPFLLSLRDVSTEQLLI